MKKSKYNRATKFIIAAVVCWLLLPVVLIFVTVICAVLPLVALIAPDIVKIKGER